MLTGGVRSRRRFWLCYALYAVLVVVFPVALVNGYLWRPRFWRSLQEVLFVLIMIASDPVGRWCFAVRPPSWCWPARLSLYSLVVLGAPLLVALLIRWTVLGLKLQTVRRHRQVLVWGYWIYGGLLVVLTFVPLALLAFGATGRWLESWEKFILTCEYFSAFCAHVIPWGLLFMLVLNILLYLAVPLVVLGVVGGWCYLKASKMATELPQPHDP